MTFVTFEIGTVATVAIETVIEAFVIGSFETFATAAFGNQNFLHGGYSGRRFVVPHHSKEVIFSSPQGYVFVYLCIFFSLSFQQALLVLQLCYRSSAYPAFLYLFDAFYSVTLTSLLVLQPTCLFSIDLFSVYLFPSVVSLISPNHQECLSFSYVSLYHVYDASHLCHRGHCLIDRVSSFDCLNSPQS